MKRLFDTLCAVLIGLLLMPVWLTVAGLVWWHLGRPILFRQQRAGLNGRPFVMIKFRTMGPERDEQGQRVPDAARTGRLGRFLRASSLDELPELWNVIRGDMALVGPRPLFIEYLPYYTEEERRRHDVRPGITGLAQIHGRNTAGWARKLSLDVHYVDHRSFWLDLKILLATLGKVIARSDLEVVPNGRRRLDELRRGARAKRDAG
ncbi:sugar transferase [Billgrantia lactosivorans]|uniref:sugar transferase n=1 Tax=Billgrantia lactosivorans TaxID=2185141 RepID=UPI00248309CC|nr:sugar transferase [Halomonas lactosivorans]